MSIRTVTSQAVASKMNTEISFSSDNTVDTDLLGRCMPPSLPLSMLIEWVLGPSSHPRISSLRSSNAESHLVNWDCMKALWSVNAFWKWARLSASLSVSLRLDDCPANAPCSLFGAGFSQTRSQNHQPPPRTLDCGHPHGTILTPTRTWQGALRTLVLPPEPHSVIPLQPFPNAHQSPY